MIRYWVVVDKRGLQEPVKGKDPICTTRLFKAGITMAARAAHPLHPTEWGLPHERERLFREGRRAWADILDIGGPDIGPLALTTTPLSWVNATNGGFHPCIYCAFSEQGVCCYECTDSDSDYGPDGIYMYNGTLDEIGVGFRGHRCPPPRGSAELDSPGPLGYSLVHFVADGSRAVVLELEDSCATINGCGNLLHDARLKGRVVPTLKEQAAVKYVHMNLDTVWEPRSDEDLAARLNIPLEVAIALRDHRMYDGLPEAAGGGA